MTHRATSQQKRLLRFHLMIKKGVKVFHKNIYGPSWDRPSCQALQNSREQQRSLRGTAGKSSPPRSTGPTQPGGEILGPRDTGSPSPGAMKALGRGDTGSHHPGRRKPSAFRAGCPGNRRPRGCWGHPSRRSPISRHLPQLEAENPELPGEAAAVA